MQYTVEATAEDSSITGELSFGEFRLDPANALLWRGHDRVALPPKPFEVLCCLIKQAGQLVTKDELLDTVWPNLHVTESSLSVSINALRVALGDDAFAFQFRAVGADRIAEGPVVVEVPVHVTLPGRGRIFP